MYYQRYKKIIAPAETRQTLLATASILIETTVWSYEYIILETTIALKILTAYLIRYIINGLI